MTPAGAAVERPHSAGAQVLQLATAYWISRALHAVAELNVADLLREGERSVEDLAHATATNADALYRVMRALAAAGVFTETGPRWFALGALGEKLRTDVPDSVRGMVRFTGEHIHWSCYGEFLYSLRTGQPAFPHVFGMQPFEYLAERPAEAALFDDAMTAHSTQENGAIVQAYDFSRAGTIVEPGGGNGSLLAAVLEANPRVRGILFDLPHVIERARAARGTHGSRLEFASGSFFEHVPAGGDIYLMKHIIHDWDDTEALRILGACRRAMHSGSRLLVAEIVVPPGDEPSYAKTLDLEMLLIPGGRERTAEEYSRLFARAGFRMAAIVPTHADVSLVEGVTA